MNDIRVGIKLTTDGSGKVQAEITQVKKGLEETGKAGEDAARKHKKAADDTAKAYGGLASQLDSVKKAALGYLTVQAAWSSSRAILDATVQMERLKGMMEAASGNAAASAQNLRFVDQTARTLGINLSAAAEGFANLSAAAQGTALQGQATRDIFTAVAKASAALGKSSADTMSMIQALGQMISKGTVSMEELRGQLGDRLPGAFQIAARAMGKTTQELDKLIASGQLTADEFLPKLAKALDATYSGARFDRLNNQLERLDNAWTKLKANILDSDAMARVIGNLTSVLERFGSDTGSALDKTRERIKELRADLSELEQQMAKPWWTRPVDISIAGPGQIENLKKEISGLENRAGGLEKLQPTAAVEQSANRQVQALGQVGAAWNKLTEAQRGYFEAAAKKYNVPQELLMAQFYQESRFKPQARSPVGAYGLGQLMPGTGRSLAAQEGQRYDPDNELQNVMLGAKYLRQNLDKFNGNVKQALASYNAGPAAVMSYGVTGKPYFDRGRWKNTAGKTTQSGLPPFKETQDYVEQILNKWLPQIKGGTGFSGLNSKSITIETDKLSKELKDAQHQQYLDYVEHLNLRQQAYDADTKVTLAKQRTRMEQLYSAQQQAEQQAKAAMAGGDQNAIRAAEEKQRKFLREKNDLIKEGIELERQATIRNLADIGRKIAAAQKDPGAFGDIEKLRADRQSELSELAALAERRTQIEIGANADIAKSAIQYEDDRRKAQRQTSDDYAQSVAERRQAMEEEYRFFQANMDLQVDRAKSLAESRKADIDATLEQAKAQASQADVARQAAMEGKTGMEAIAQARENVNAKLADSLHLIDLEKAATLDKLRIDGDILASQRALLEVYREVAAQRGNRDDVLKTEQQLQAVYDAQTKNIRARVQAEMDAAGAAAKAKVSATGDMGDLGKKQIQEVADELLRLNKIWDNAVQAVEEYSKTFVSAFGQVGETLANVANIMATYERRQQRINSEADEAIRKSPGKKQEIDQKRYLDSLANTSDLMANMALTARKFTKEGSDGYKAMTIAAQSFAAISQSINLALGIQAVLKQLVDGDSYSALFRAIAVAAFVGSLGIAVAGIASGSSGGGQSRESAQDRRDKQLSGTILGDDTAFSESLANSLNIVAENSSADLDYSAGMLRALTNIEKLLGGAAASVASGLMNMPNLFKLGKGWEFSDIGLSSVDKTLGQYFGGGGFQGAAWGEIVKEAADGTKRYKDIFTELNGTIKSQFTRVILGIADSVKKAGESFGLNASDFQAKMMSFVVSFGNISFGDLKGDDLEKAVQQMFSKMSDQMAQAFMPGLNAFQQVGEGYYETLVRVSNGIMVATGMLEQAGLQAINYQQIVLKQGDVAAEIIRQSIVMFEGATSAIGAYVDQAVGSAEELMSVYQDLLIVSDTAKLTGFNLNNLSNALIVTSGGVSKFLANLQTYQTEILGGSDYARQMITLQREFAKIGQAVPANNAAFVKLVNGIDTTTEAGQKLYAQILALAGAFSKAQQEAQKLEELRNKYLPKDSMADYRKQIDQVGKDFKEIIEGTLAGMKGGATYIKRTSRITALTDLKTDRQDELDLVNEDIAKLEAKAKLTQKEKQTLAGLRQQRKELEAEIADTDKQIAKINKLIAANKNTKGLIEERNKLIEEQGNAIIQTIADIWDKMTQAINAAKQTLISINDSIFEFTASSSAPDIKLGMMTARAETAGKAYFNYGGNDINELNKFADAYYKAIMDEYQAKLDFIEAPKKALEKERDLAEKAHQEKIDALQKELDKVRELADAVNAIKKFALDMKLGPQSTLNPRAQLLEAQKQYEDLLKRSQGGDVKAMQELTGGADKYLEVAQKYFGGSKRYGEIFERVRLAMEEIGAIDVPDAVSIQDKIDQLNKDHEVYLKGIEDKIAALKIDEQIKALQIETAAKLQMLADDLGPRITKAEEQAKKDMQTLIAEAVAGNKLNQEQLDALDAMLKSIGIERDKTPTPPVQPNIPEPSLPAPTDDWVQRMYEEWLKTQTGYKAPLPAFANGGLAQPGWALVGEEGPELVKFGAQAQVYDAERTARMLREMASFQPVPKKAGRPINMEVMPRTIDDIQPKNNEPAKLYSDDVVAELRAVQREVKALVTTQSGANPQIIDKLANLDRRMESIERQQRIRV